MEILSKDLTIRYSRNILLEGIGKSGQCKLLNSSVLIIGTGALGSIVAMYLAGSGIGKIGIADYDTIDITNLQRQLSFEESDCGKSKVETMADKLKSVNSGIKVVIYNKLMQHDDLIEICNHYDVVVECTDNPYTKYLVTDVCVALGVPYCLGGVAQYKGQVMSWNKGALCYRDIFPESADRNDYMPCSLGGVLGPLPGIIGSIQASEVIKIIVGIGTPLYNRMLLIDALNMDFQIVRL